MSRYFRETSDTIRQVRYLKGEDRHAMMRRSNCRYHEVESGPFVNVNVTVMSEEGNAYTVEGEAFIDQEDKIVWRRGSVRVWSRSAWERLGDEATGDFSRLLPISDSERYPFTYEWFTTLFNPKAGARPENFATLREQIQEQQESSKVRLSTPSLTRDSAWSARVQALKEKQRKR